MLAFSALEKLRRRLVRGPGLDKPVVRALVAALLAFLLHVGQVGLVIINDNGLVLRRLVRYLYGDFCGRFFAAVPAYVPDEKPAALTKLHLSIQATQAYKEIRHSFGASFSSRSPSSAAFSSRSMTSTSSSLETVTGPRDNTWRPLM